MTQQRQTTVRQQTTVASRARQAATPVRASDAQQMQGVVADPSHASAEALLSLQARYGNRAVTQLVSRAPAGGLHADQSGRPARAAFAPGAHPAVAEISPSGPVRAGASTAGTELISSAQSALQRKSNKPQAAVKQRSGPMIQLNRKNRRARQRAAQQSTTPLIAPPPTRLMIAPPGKTDVKPTTGREKETPSTAPLMLAPPTSESTTESPKEESTGSEGSAESHPIADRVGAGADLLNDIVDVKDAYYEYQKSGNKIESMGAIAKGGGKSVSALQNASLLTGAIDKDSQVLSYSTAISQGAAIVAAGAESYKAFNEMRESWGWSLTEIWENTSKIGALIEKVMDVVKGVADIVKTFFESFKDFELPLLDKIKQAAVIVQKVLSFNSSWTRFVNLKSKQGQEIRGKSKSAKSKKADEREIKGHLIELTWDQMKQSAWEILAAGVNLGASFAKGTGVGLVYGYLIELGGKIAEGGGKAYVSGLRGARESGYTPGWLFDKNKTTEKRKQIALKIKRLNLPYLYEAAGIAPSDHGDLAKIQEALAQPN